MQVANTTSSERHEDVPPHKKSVKSLRGKITLVCEVCDNTFFCQPPHPSWGKSVEVVVLPDSWLACFLRVSYPVRPGDQPSQINKQSLRTLKTLAVGIWSIRGLIRQFRLLSEDTKTENFENDSIAKSEFESYKNFLTPEVLICQGKNWYLLWQQRTSTLWQIVTEHVSQTCSQMIFYKK